MRQSLQSKFNALGVLFVILFLLMLPMFTQVKADARESAKEAKSTVLSKLFRQIAKDLKPEDVGDEEIEDYWARYGNEAKEKDPNCGAACDPDADADGDGVSNKDEVKNGTNPKCNEKEKGEEFCKDIDPFTPVDPENQTKAFAYDYLGTIFWRAGDSSTGSNCTASGPGVAVTTSCRDREIRTTKNYTRLLLYLNVTEVRALSWTWTQSNDVGAPAPTWSPSNPSGGFDAQPRNYPNYEGRIEPGDQGLDGTFRFRPNPQQATSGLWALNVYGLVEA
ncbi:MAG: hypothetical protein HYT80_09085 [Euryarchaeota archaeon]|nr:hypothetical protein [Euryarchaeota archaeon]